MQADRPKQFLTLAGKTVLEHSLTLLLSTLPQDFNNPPAKVVLVMNEEYRGEFEHLVGGSGGRLVFADPGIERQGSVENGLNKIFSVVSDAFSTGAAVLGVPCKATIKESSDGEHVLRTIPRSRLWEIHTPQVIGIETLARGFEKVRRENLEVTDDVSIVEAMGEKVKLTRGEYTNLKITTPEDMEVAEAIIKDRMKGGKKKSLWRRMLRKA
ncbi:hypothetical protein TrRE_jg4799 [Triparma retinervis]|uniref:2-C-methyl-D-erythritol 4-phosphate cytidylyltransferase n=1 Tax=Triparma retinervis TaxID=2557542 RepID=A0A9W6ZE98_9STRA|nr:hypothetical protein TrRE_jg4799 [Triparma retinervis]